MRQILHKLFAYAIKHHRFRSRDNRYAALIPELMQNTVDFNKEASVESRSNVEVMLKEILERLDGEKNEKKPRLRLVKYNV